MGLGFIGFQGAAQPTLALTWHLNPDSPQGPFNGALMALNSGYLGYNRG